MLRLTCLARQAAHWAAELGSAYSFQPTEYDSGALDSIRLYTQGLENVAAPLELDASAPEQWPAEPSSCDAVVAVNLCHIAPVEATRGLMQGAARVLKPGGRLCVYGPFLIDGKPTTDSNAACAAATQSHPPPATPKCCRPLRAHCTHPPPSPLVRSFDASLRSRDPSWGIRDVAELDGYGAPALARVALDEMPANNFFAVWERTA